MIRRSILALVVLPAAICSVSAADAENRVVNEPPNTAARPAVESKRYPADNSAVNANDNMRGRLTADDQGQDGMETTRQIRSALVSRDDLSTYAKNIKIITEADGMVTLRGPVRSIEERGEVRKIAEQIAGAKKVKDSLEIAPEK